MKSAINMKGHLAFSESQQQLVNSGDKISVPKIARQF